MEGKFESKALFWAMVITCIMFMLTWFNSDTIHWDYDKVINLQKEIILEQKEILNSSYVRREEIMRSAFIGHDRQH